MKRYTLALVALLSPLHVNATEAYPEVWLNGEKLIDFAKLSLVNDTVFLSSDILDALKQRLHKLPTQKKSVFNANACESAQIECLYDENKQRFDIQVPASWLGVNRFSRAPFSDKIQPASDLGLLHNYLFTSSKLDGIEPRIDWLQEWRAFFGRHSFSFDGNYRIKGDDRFASVASSSFTRFNTTWRSLFPESNQVLTIGDTTSRGGSLLPRYRFAGLSWRSDYSLTPDEITYPYPEFTGSAQLPSNVELLINSQRVFNQRVNSGDFVVSYPPAAGGLQTATLLTQDIQGRSVQRQFSFYVAPNNLRQGLTDFDLSLGVLREEFGRDSWQYNNDISLLSNFRYGLTDTLTLTSGVNANSQTQNVEIGSSIANTWGVVELSVAQSFPSNATSYQTSYQFRTNKFSVGLRYKDNAAGFNNLDSNQIFGDVSSESQFRFAYNLADNGSINASYVKVNRRDEENTELFSVTANRRVYGANLSLTASKFAGEGTALSLNVNIPFSTPASYNLNVNRSANRRSNTIHSLRYRSRNNLGIDALLSAAPDSENYSARASLKTRTNDWRIQAETRESYDAYFLDIGGSVTLFNKDVHFGRRINDAFALVSTNGVADIPVSVENQYVGTTNSNGFLMIPDVPAMRQIRVKLQTERLPLHYQVSDTEQSVSLFRNSGTLAPFIVNKKYPIIFTLITESGTPLPAGTTVTIFDEQEPVTTMVGYDGQVYAEVRGETISVSANQADATRCSATLTTPLLENNVSDMGTLTCEEIPNDDQ